MIAKYALSKQKNLIKRITRKKFLQICTTVPLSLTTTKNLFSRGLKFPKKIMALKFYGNMHFCICVLNAYNVSRYSMQQFEKSCAYKLFITTCIFDVWPKLYKFKRTWWGRNLHIFKLCPKCLHSFSKFHAAV